MALFFAVMIVVLGIIEMSMGFMAYAHDGRHTKQNHFFFMTCVMGAVWCIGYGFMGIAATNEEAYIMRAIGLTGIFFYYYYLLNYILSITGNPFRFQKLVNGYILVGAIGSLLLVIGSGSTAFIDTPYGKDCYAVSRIGRYEQAIYLFSLLMIWIYAVIKWMKRISFKRELHQAKVMLSAVVILCFGALWDGFTIMIGIPSYQGGTIIAFFATCVLGLVLRKHNAFSITDGKMAGYIYEKVNTPVILLNHDYTVADCNERACELLQIEKEKLFGTDIFEQVREEDVAVRQRVRAQIANKEPKFAMNIITNAAEAICEVDGSVLYDKFKDVTCIICMLHDMTETYRVMKELEQSRQEAARANEAKTAFLSNMSHEIRTPLNSIIGMCDIMGYKDLTDDIKNDIGVIQGAGKGLLSVINDILDISKIESGKVELIERTYDMKGLLEDVIHMMGIRILDKKITFITIINPNMPQKLIGDSGRVKQLLINVLSNAIKYTNEGYITLDIDYRLVFGKISLTIKVSDTGIGIRPEDKEKIFGSFNQVDTVKNRNIVGTGLGLTICRNISRIMGGDVTVDSVYGEGSTFTITLNQKVEDESPMVPYAKYEMPVLLIEADKRLSNAHTRTLDELHVPYKFCSTMNEAEKILETEKPSVILVQDGLFAKLSEIKGIHDYAIRIIRMIDFKTYVKEEKKAGQICETMFSLNIGNVLNSNETEVVEQRNWGYSTNIAQHPNAKVLIVDDSKTNITVVAGLLKPFGMKLVFAGGGYEAIEKIKTERFDLVLMDQMMPDMDGVETTVYIRQELGISEERLPVVLLTANRIEDVRENMDNKGFNDYMEKPINLAILNSMIMKYIK